MASVSKSRIIQKCEKLNCTFDEDDGHTIYIYAPPGKIFEATGSHCLCYRCEDVSGNSFRTKVYPEMLDDLEHGLLDCEELNCDICKENNQ